MTNVTRKLVRAINHHADFGTPAVVVALSINGVRSVNSRFGRMEGDTLIETMAARLARHTAPNDTMEQASPTEFLLVRPGADIAAGLDWAGCMVHTVGRPVRISGEFVTVSGSAGVCAIRPGASPLQATAALSHATAALQRAREEGRGQALSSSVCVYEPAIDGAAVARDAMAIRLRAATDNFDFSLHYQPQIDLRTLRITGFEALLRWCDPVHGPVSPAIFIPLAEELGLVGVIGAWALKVACRTACDWPADLGVAVNVSALQLNDGSLAAAVRAALDSTGLAPARLELELTESCVVDYPPAAAAALQALREMGVRVAIDDFGTGVTSLGSLPDLPIDRIKIDRSFTARIVQGSAQQAIIRSIVGLCHDLGVQCMAEGVETPDQMAVLSGLACGSAQGFFLGRPMPAPGVAEMLARYGQ